jgi:hypothetical protein
MTQAEKLTKLKTLLNITGTEQDATLTVFLELSKSEILAWLYSGKPPDDVTDVPKWYEPTQIFAVVAGFSQSGAEGQTAHSENGISRNWKYEDMLSYIRGHVFPYVQVL